MRPNTRLVTLVIAVAFLAACTSDQSSPEITFELLKAWYADRTVYYITTEVSDQQMAHATGANYAPRLVHAIPDYPKPPQQKTILERVYAFPNGEQAQNVFASIPEPLGPTSIDRGYSPIWLMYVVTWKNPDMQRELRSEAAILDAEAAGWVAIERTNVVLNCPIVKLDQGAALPVAED